MASTSVVSLVTHHTICHVVAPNLTNHVASFRRSLTQSFPGHDAWALSVAASPCGRAVVSCGADGTVKLWDLTQGLGVGGKMAQSVSDVSDATWGACFKPGTAGGETASHTTPFAWCTPFLKDFSRRHSSPALPFQRLTGKTFD